MKIILKIIALFVFVVALISGTALKEPILETTASFSKVIPLQNNQKTTFTTHFTYDYKIELRIENTDQTKLHPFQYKLTVEGKETEVSNKYSLGNTFTNIGTFSATKDDQCSFEILNLPEELKGKNAFLKIDVNGGGPSTSEYWTKEMRPTVKLFFWISSVAFLLLLVIIFNGRIKAH